MGGKAIIYCLLVVLLCDVSTGFYRSLRLNRPVRKCTRRNFPIFGRPCRNPVIPMRPTTMEPKLLLPPTTEVTTPRAVPLLHASGLPYCTPRDVNAVLQQSNRRTKRAVAWPYKCNYVSILQQSKGDYQFIWPIYDCCSKCSFPEFSSCVAESARKSSPKWLCPSNGLHCVVDCVNKHKPTKISTSGIIMPSIVRPDILKPLPKPGGGKPTKPFLNRCEKLEMENGKRCIQKLCVSLKYKP